MAMEAVEIERMIRDAFPNADVEIKDLAGDGNHYAATVVASEFTGISRVKQHQMVYAALKGKMDGPAGELHALALTTRAPAAPQTEG
ncbi:BolA family protein [Algicella marina]|uniref:BolA/IbaG family iron-sulfur metabolism protein n=1 Tax=Algicella marina TaxID=2683284 RepID=A0A6P1SY70_9RHOB|nr:BolA family transcriptional regulator [Algicella marina]QHQ34580.1 BolA/IbaG family iron-sulfur metabolism protein [Algicella marina]